MKVKVWNIHRWGRKTVCYVIGEGSNWLGAHFTTPTKADNFREFHEHQQEVDAQTKPTNN